MKKIHVSATIIISAIVLMLSTGVSLSPLYGFLVPEDITKQGDIMMEKGQMMIDKGKIMKESKMDKKKGADSGDGEQLFRGWRTLFRYHPKIVRLRSEISVRFLLK
jgi:hypothetical protein